MAARPVSIKKSRPAIPSDKQGSSVLEITQYKVFD